MPTYHYQCRSCGHELEEFQSMTEPVLTHCPSCRTENLVRSIGTGAGLIFKGTGFYLTDYKKGRTSGETKPESTGSGSGEKGQKGEKAKGDPGSGGSTPEKPSQTKS